MIAGLVEYVSLRLVRRFVFSNTFLIRFGRFVPYYRANANQSGAGAVVDVYERAIARAGLPLVADRSILEIGSGATNSVGYELQRRRLAGPAGVIQLYEPYVALDRRSDAELRRGLEDDCLTRVERLASLASVPDHSIDLLLSNSVLEHVIDMDRLLASLERVLKPGASMIHAVDYRDHFFKYPYHFLIFRAEIWKRWLDPGDLPRWRLSGHLKELSARGFQNKVLDSHTLPEAFETIRTSISEDFDSDDPTIAMTSAVILSTLAERRPRVAPRHATSQQSVR